MPAFSALVLFAHGARDPSWALPLHRLRSALEASAPALRVEIAFLEMQTPALPEVLAALAAQGCTAIAIAPVFWSQGGHVAKDLPPLLEGFGRTHPGLTLRVLPVLSELPGMMGFLAQALQALAQD